MTDFKTQDIFTTGNVAEICQVTNRTVAKWFDRGLLKGFTIPGSKHRKIPRKALITFLRENKMDCLLAVLE